MKDLLDRDGRVLWHPFSHAATEPPLLPVASAEGAWLTLTDGTKLLDAIASWWTCLHGHGIAEINEAIARQAARLDHVAFAGATHEPAVELAEKLLTIAPRGLARVFYSDDGSTAVEVALKTAIQYYQLRGERRRSIVALEGGYHGDTFGAMAVGAPGPFTRPFEDYLFHVDRTPAPRGLAATDATDGALAALERILSKKGKDIAAVITEPILQGAAGMRVHPPAFVRGVRELCSQYGTLWIADEVFTGFGRTGRIFACEHAGVSPDLLCVAKGLAGGALPLAATLCAENVYEPFQSGGRARAFFHGHSFTANPIACAAALASHALLARPDFLQKIITIESALGAGLAPLRGHRRVRDVRGIGAVWAVELDAPSDYVSDLTLALRREAARRGVLLRPLGPVIYSVLPACAGAAEIELFIKCATALVAFADDWLTSNPNEMQS